MERLQLRPKIRVLSLVLALIVVLSTLSVPRATHAAGELVYVGQATMRVQQQDVYGRPLGWQSFTTNVQMIMAPPRQVRGLREPGPFSLSVQSTPLANRAGEFSLYSSMVFDNTLFQYWDLRCTDQRCTSFEGQLIDTHVNEALALNLITLRAEIAPNLWMPMSYAMVEGTRLQSTTRSDGRKVIQIVGNTTEMAAPFEIVIVVQPQGM